MPEPASGHVECLRPNVTSPQHFSSHACCGCTYSTVHVDGSKGLLDMQIQMHGVAKDASCTDIVHPIAMPPCHPAMYNQPFLYTPARSKPFCYITSTRRSITRSHVTRPFMERDPGHQACCDTTSARGSSMYATLCSNIVKSYASYMICISRMAR